MKKTIKILILFVFVLSVVQLQAQTIHYSYDAVGNRVAHNIQTEEAQLRVTPSELTLFSMTTNEIIQIENLGDADLNWTAVSNDGWITIDGNSSGTNNGTITLVIAENTSAERQGTVTITATDALNCPYTLNVTQNKGNNAPVIVNGLQDITKYEGFSSLDIDIANVFSDADGDILEYIIENEDDAIATISLSDTILTIYEVGIGITSITIIADDNLGGTVSDEFTLSILDPNNNAPYLVNPLEYQNAEVGTEFSYIVPENAFSDNDTGDELTYSAELSTGELLPDWLIFNTDNRTFNGTPIQEETLVIRVRATDQEYASASDIFTLTVTNPSGLSDVFGKEFKLYPNPTNGILYANMTSITEDSNIKIQDANGKLIISRFILANQEIIEFDLSVYSAGIYLFTIETQGAIKTERIIFK